MKVLDFVKGCWGALTFRTAPDYESPNDAAYTTPADAAASNKYVVKVRATSGAGARQKSTDQTIIVTVADDDPTGTPSASGTEQVGQTLMAATANIADQAGLTTPGYTYQWRPVDGGIAADTTTPPDAVAKVRVTHNGSNLSVS